MEFCWFRGKTHSDEQLRFGRCLGSVITNSVMRWAGPIGAELTSEHDRHFDKGTVAISTEYVIQVCRDQGISLTPDQRKHFEDEKAQAVGDCCHHDVVDERNDSGEVDKPQCWFSMIKSEPMDLVWGLPLLTLFSLGMPLAGSITVSLEDLDFFLFLYSHDGHELPLESIHSFKIAVTQMLGTELDSKRLLRLAAVRPCICKAQLAVFQNTLVDSAS